MKKTTDYQIVCVKPGKGGDVHLTLQAQVVLKLKEGWKPLGAPCFGPKGEMYQAVERPIKAESRVEARSLVGF